MRSIGNSSFSTNYCTVLEPGTRVLIVAGIFYENIVAQLLDGALTVLKAAHCEVTTLKVPGALEIPVMVSIALEQGEKQGIPYQAVVVLGCVIRGETSHYDVVVRESARAIMDIAVAKAIPLGNGILTVETPEQAQARANPYKSDSESEGDLGGRAAKAALTLCAHKICLDTGSLYLKEQEPCIA